MPLLRRSFFVLSLSLSAFSGSAQDSPPALSLDVPAAEVDTAVEILPEMVVTATRNAIPVFDAPASVITADEVELDRFGGFTFQEALARDASVEFSNRQALGLFPAGLEVRGLSTNNTSGGNVLFLLDGIPQRRMSFGGPYLGALPNAALERVELIKGPAASLYGRGALAGAAQLFTKPGTDVFSGDLRTVYEGGTDTYSASGTISGPLFGLSTGSISGNYTNSNGWQPRTQLERWDIYTHLRFVIDENDVLDVFGGVFQGRQEAAAPIFIDRNGSVRFGLRWEDNLGVPGFNELEIEEYRAGFTWAHDFSETVQQRITVGYWNGQTDWKIARPSDSPATGTIVQRPASLQGWDEDNWFLELQEQFEYQPAAWLKGTLTIGSALDRSRWESTVTNISIPGSSGIPLDLATRKEPNPSTFLYGTPSTREAEEFNYGFFARNVFTIAERFDLHLGIRYDHFERDQTNVQTGASGTLSDDALSPSVGFVYRVVDKPEQALNFFGSWGRGFNPVFRAVTSAEIVAIEPETSESFELGIRGRAWGDKLEAELLGYTLKRMDAVGFSAAANTYLNAGDSTISGIEASALVRPFPGAWIKGSYTWREPRIDRDILDPLNEGNDIVFVSRQRAYVELGYKDPSGWFASTNLLWVDQSYADAANRITIPSYALLGAEIGWENEHARISVYANNITDEEYYSDVFLGTVNGAAFAGTPRTVGVTAQIRF